MQDWTGYRNSLHEAVGVFARHNPEAMLGISTLASAAEKQGHLDPKVHELIALAVAVTTRCDGCIAVHTKKAKEFGATVDEISEALGVAISLNAGAALTYSARVMDAYRQLEGQ